MTGLCEGIATVGNASRSSPIGMGAKPAEAREEVSWVRRRACGAMANSLRLNHERRLVSREGIEPDPATSRNVWTA